MTIQDYLNLLTSAWSKKPKYTAVVSANTSILVQIQNLLTSMNSIFDLDNPPVGDQLDIIGQWAGVSRQLAIPIGGVFFTWDGSDPSVGWDQGSWQPSTLPADLTTLPDDVYLTLIKAKIAANNWDGTINGAYAIWDTLFSQYTILIQDNQDMTYDLAVIGSIVDSLTIAIIVQGLIPLRPEAVAVYEYYFSVDTNPAFAWDVENANMAGWDTGSWLREEFP